MNTTQELLTSRRKFLTAAGIAIPAILLGGNRAWSATVALGNIRSQLVGLATGQRDATATIQMLIDQSVAQGIAAEIPTGKYLVNPDTGIYLRTGSRLIMAEGAQLISAPSTNSHYSILRLYSINNASVTGGSIIGERHNHAGSGGEWGMGLDIRGSSNIVIAGVIVSDCWGDGFYIGKGVTDKQPCKNITLMRVSGIGNRRQGLSIVACIGAKIIDSTFSKTIGTSPAAGIDVEPDVGDPIGNILIQNCVLTNNAGAGLETRTHAEDVTVENCTISGNTQGGVLLLNNAKRITLTNNTISNSRGPSIHVGKNVQGYTLHSNTMQPTFMGKGLEIER